MSQLHKFAWGWQDSNLQRGDRQQRKRYSPLHGQNAEKECGLAVKYGRS